LEQIKKISVSSYILFFMSLVVMGLGISTVTHANLGTTAITSPPYVLSLSSLPLSFGTLTILFNIIYILIQIALMRKDFPKVQYLQIIVSFVLGWSIDFWAFIIQNVANTNYLFQLFLVVLGCFIVAFSIRMQLRANVVNNPAEGIVRAFAIKTKMNFARVKVIYDTSLVVLALVFSLLLFGGIQGVREGTIISAIITGYFVKIIQKIY